MFEWDETKARSNFTKHGVRFSTDAVAALSDDYSLVRTDDESYPGKERFVALGRGLERVLVVVFTYREDRIRIISVRPANATERREYAEQR